MTWPITDTFTEASNTNFGSHTADTGQSWAAEFSGTSLGVFNSNYLVDAATDTAITGSVIDSNSIRYVNDAAPSADYTVEADFIMGTTANFVQAMLVGRMVVGDNDFYSAELDPSPAAIILRRFDNGGAGFVTLSSASVSISAGNTYRVQLYITDALKKAVFDLGGGGESEVTSTDNTHTASGYAGLLERSLNTTDLHLDNFAAAVISASGSDLVKVISESLGISDDQGRPLALNRLLAETMGLDEAAIRSMALSRARDETVGVDETALRAMTLARLQAEGIGIGEAAAAPRALNRTRGETVGITEAPSIARGLAKIVDDVVGVAETTVNVLGQTGLNIVAVIAETVGLAETAQRIRSLTRVKSEIEGIIEARIAARLLARMRAESVGTSEGTTRSIILARLQDESIGVDETVAKARGLSLVINEAMGLVEAVLKVLATPLFTPVHETTVLTGRLHAPTTLSGRIVQTTKLDEL